MSASRTRWMVLAATLLTFAVGVEAQEDPVVGRQATAKDTGIQEVASPMLLEFSIGAKEGGKPLADPSVKGRTYYETKGFSCAKLQIPKVTVMKKPGKQGGVDLEVQPYVKTGATWQDVTLKVSVVADGKELPSKAWSARFTVGDENSTANKIAGFSAFGEGGSSSRMPIAKFSFAQGELEHLTNPRLRLIVTIEETR